MVLSQWHRCVCVLLAACVPVSLVADDSGSAMLRSNGGVLLNRSAAPSSSALFPGDVVETQAQSPARIELVGSTIDITPGTVLEFDGDEIRLDHGSVSVLTSRSFRVRAGCELGTPAYEDWTQYDVTDKDGTVTVAAQKKDVNLDSRSSHPRPAKQSAKSERVSVHEGEQKSRPDKCGPAIPKSANAAAIDGILNNPFVKWAALGVAGGIACWALCRGDDPISPSSPSNSPGSSGP